MIAAMNDRVVRNTSDCVNQEIERRIHENVERAARGGIDAINRRLAELDEEWDIERYLETMAPSLTLAGLTLGLTVNRKWLALPFLVQAFFLQHAIQGWCPPIPILRRLGIRTTHEIDRERHALKALRGDYRYIDRDTFGGADQALNAAQN